MKGEPTTVCMASPLKKHRSSFELTLSYAFGTDAPEVSTDM